MKNARYQVLDYCPRSAVRASPGPGIRASPVTTGLIGLAGLGSTGAFSSLASISHVSARPTASNVSVNPSVSMDDSDTAPFPPSFHAPSLPPSSTASPSPPSPYPSPLLNPLYSSTSTLSSPSTCLPPKQAGGHPSVEARRPHERHSTMPLGLISIEARAQTKATGESLPCVPLTLTCRKFNFGTTRLLASPFRLG
ncbi:unnamed protein product [Protopolystoma xenopodis]|uniref:Uncharacterized protein n=1 Tax=Protopolystoma xenopodis TaxID=117903 RepID=A0A3S5FH70_9PLAT|nr:unnamed protein product [Protopolystoma xenopodis]